MISRTNERRTRHDSKDKSPGKNKSEARRENYNARRSELVEVLISKEPADVVQVRQNVNNMVWNAAESIAIALINDARSGQLAAVKYLFEAVGMYPATKETEARPKENSLAYMLLKRLGLPTEPMTYEGDSTEKVDTVE